MLLLTQGCGGSVSEEATAADAAASVFKATPLDTHRLPLGDGRYERSGPRRGYVYSCITDFNGGRAFRQGPWIDSASGTWDLTEKISVEGRQVGFALQPSVSGSRRKLSGNGLPPQPSGVFPVSPSDPA